LPGKLIASQSGRIVEGAAQNAAAGGWASRFMGMFTNLPAESFAQAAEKLGVPAAALASGYTAFFIYSTLIGTFAVVLAFMVARRDTSPSPGTVLGAVEQPHR